MDIKQIIKNDNQRVANNEAIKKMQNDLIKAYEKDLEVWEELTNKLRIKKDYRNEVHEFFLENGFVKSDTDNEGRVFISDSTTYYKNQNTWVIVTFNEYSETEDIIQVRFPADGKLCSFSYILNDDSREKLELIGGFTLDRELIYKGNYKEVISKCDSIEELSKLDKNLKDHTQYLENNINKDINTDGVYQLENKKQFKTFKEVFEAF
ncbi:hypothetical protein WHY35_15495 (plasmid) [Clostridium perfringens]|uniref:hypothetical protein n=1 Tax=Clostridium perfringens TaxID=1502 RepID=UPI0030D0C4A8